jgi:NADH:ubiquinone oxidoreductase subunit D
MATVIDYPPLDLASAMGGGAVGMSLEEDGGLVSKATLQAGFGARNIESISSNLPMVLSVIYSDRLDYMAAPAYNCVAASCYEALLGVEISERAHYIRTILLEINRINSHLDYISRVSRVAGQHSLTNYCLREREKFSDLFEMYCGSRLAFGSVCIGGVREDATDGWLFKIEKALRSAKNLMTDVDTLLLSQPHYKERALGLLKISRQEADIWSLSGPNAKSAGVMSDLRIDKPYFAYKNIKLNLIEQMSNESDAWSRLKFRMAEVSQSVSILEHCFGRIPDGNHRIRVGVDVAIPKGRAFKSIEGPRGIVSMLLDSSGDGVSVKYFTPSAAVFRVLPQLLNGLLVEDVLLAIQSLDISMSEVDK